ncbi:kinase-like domain-containing protein [Pilobolus umbonatus]|nr:kinase-like domain-containing protein [Pilobolus umbonatus]
MTVHPFIRHQHEIDVIHTHSNKRSIIVKHRREIGDYVLTKTIGRGASGRVKLGIHKQTGEKVAIKMISRNHLTASTLTSKSVQRELAILQLLNHPYLIDLIQVLQDATYVYFVTEYLEGGELFHLLTEHGRLSEPDTRHIFVQLANAINWCHTHHISHRDLKPENILLDKSRRNIKIADFGMATLQPLNSLLRTSCGSPHYASPEIIKGSKYDGMASDVWSCGVILYAMLTSHLPFDDENMGRLLSKIKTGRYRPIPYYLSSDAKDLLGRMLTVDPAKRMTMNDVLYHPWTTNQSFLGTELRFLKYQPPNPSPQIDPILLNPMITQYSDIDGKTWETLKILWRDLSESDIISHLLSTGYNIQKLTYKLLTDKKIQADHEKQAYISHHDQSSITTDEGISTPPLSSIYQGTDDVDSLTLSVPYHSSIDTMSCYKSLNSPVTPKNTITYLDLSPDTDSNINKYWDQGFHSKDLCPVHPLLSNKWTTQPRYWIFNHPVESNMKSTPADLFVMKKPIHTSFMPVNNIRTRWQLSSCQTQTEVSFWDKLCHSFKPNKPKKKRVIAIQYMSNDESETAGKLHQVLEECFRGKLSGRMYPHGRIIWSGSMRITKISFLYFTCHMQQLNPSIIEIKFSLEQGDRNWLESSIHRLLKCLNKYEVESDWLSS